MTTYSKYNIVYRLQKWMDSVPGQTFLNYAYSWGASVVILGTLFKLTHLPGANIMLFIGMGTEVVVFFLSAFDRPFDKTAIGMDLATHVDTSATPEEGEPEEDQASDAAGGTAGGMQVAGGGTIIIGGGAGAGETAAEGGVVAAAGGAQGGAGGVVVGGASVAAGDAAWLRAQQEMAPEMEEATGNYVDELKKLTEMLAKVSEQSERLTRDSEEMENLNRTLTSICKIYELQLKGASAQIGTIDQINEQSRRMADQIAELNSIYARMIDAMTVNMKAQR